MAHAVALLAKNGAGHEHGGDPGQLLLDRQKGILDAALAARNDGDVPVAVRARGAPGPGAVQHDGRGAGHRLEGSPCRLAEALLGDGRTHVPARSTSSSETRSSLRSQRRGAVLGSEWLARRWTSMRRA